MNFRIILSVIFVSSLVGFIIFKLITNKTQYVQKIVTQNYSSNESPSPKQTLPPINASSNLEQEINKLTPPDFSEDFKNLKEEVSN